MIRTEKAKRDCAIIVPDDMEYGAPVSAAYNKGVEAGVKWADSHPNWRKYPEDKPKAYNDYQVYLEDPDGYFMVEVYAYDPKAGGFGYLTTGDSRTLEWKSVDRLVKAWMELPKPPKFD